MEPLTTNRASGRAPLTLSQRASFWVSAGVVAHTLWTSAAPAVTYPLYAAQWHLTPTVTTAIFAVYPISVVAALFAFGNLSDCIGRRAAMLLGLAASQGGVLLFAVGPSVAYIFAGRVWMGLGVGLSASAATAALVEFSPPDDVQRANSIATVAMGVGFALATLIGGALIQYGAYPMRLNFGVLLVVLVVLFIATWFVPSAGSNSMPSWHPGKISIDRNIRKPFTASTVAMSTGYALGAVVLSLGAQIARDVIGSGNAFVNGAAIALYALTGSIITLLAKRLAGKHAIILGSAANLCAMALLTLSSNLRSLPLFVAALTSAGIAYGLMFLGGYALINAHAPPDQRAGTLSAIYLVAYLLMGSIAIGLGKTATAWGLRTAVEVGSVLIATLGTLGGVLAMCYGNSSKGSL